MAGVSILRYKPNLVWVSVDIPSGVNHYLVIYCNGEPCSDREVFTESKKWPVLVHKRLGPGDRIRAVLYDASGNVVADSGEVEIPYPKSVSVNIETLSKDKVRFYVTREGYLPDFTVEILCEKNGDLRRCVTDRVYDYISGEELSYKFPEPLSNGEVVHVLVTYKGKVLAEGKATYVEEAPRTSVEVQILEATPNELRLRARSNGGVLKVSAVYLSDIGSGSYSEHEVERIKVLGEREIDIKPEGPVYEWILYSCHPIFNTCTVIKKMQVSRVRLNEIKPSTNAPQGEWRGVKIVGFYSPSTLAVAVRLPERKDNDTGSLEYEIYAKTSSGQEISYQGSMDLWQLPPGGGVVLIYPPVKIPVGTKVTIHARLIVNGVVIGEDTRTVTAQVLPHEEKSYKDTEWLGPSSSSSSGGAGGQGGSTSNSSSSSTESSSSNNETSSESASTGSSGSPSGLGVNAGGGGGHGYLLVPVSSGLGLSSIGSYGLVSLFSPGTEKGRREREYLIVI